MCRILQRFALLSATLILSGCQSLQVQSPICNVPPLPASSVSACPVPSIPPPGPMPESVLFQRYLESLSQQKECLSKYSNFVEQAREREAREKACKDQAQAPDKPWWKF